MNKVIYFSALLLFSGCSEKKQLPSGINYDKNSGVLEIDPSMIKIRKVAIKSKENFKNYLYFNESGKLKLVNNTLKLSAGGNDIINTWTAFDKQGNIDIPYSFFYTTDLSFDSIPFVNCHLEKLTFEDNQKNYLLLSDYDQYFKSNKIADTIFFKNYSAAIPLKKWKRGENNIRFIIVEKLELEKEIKLKKTYVDKSFTIE